MKVFLEGIKVTSVIGNIEGIITGISIRGKNASYEISYFYNGEYRQVWLYEFEIVKNTKQKAGFMKEEPQVNYDTSKQINPPR